MELDRLGVLETMIDEYLMHKQRENGRPMRGKLHPSTIGMCPRRIAFEMMMVPQDIDSARAQRIFDNGHALHHRYESLFEEMGILVQAEMKIEKENISGHTDAWIKLKNFACPQGEDVLVELKSASNKSFSRMKEANVPKDEHRAQLMFYLHLTGIKKGIILVENKDTQETWEYELLYNEAEALSLMEKANRIIELSKKRELPPIPEKYHTATSYNCTYCPFNFYCHGDSVNPRGELRYPVPFGKGTKFREMAEAVQEAVRMNKTIPDLIEGSTKGNLVESYYKNN